METIVCKLTEQIICRKSGLGAQKAKNHCCKRTTLGFLSKQICPIENSSQHMARCNQLFNIVT